ncbi:hypothetical protein SAMN05519104_3132 [Rhizobiales bacterium GAS188]|nr:hypothetical protein SAMN05519104_3132 [Rhizobiales bacterium GAS188]
MGNDEAPPITVSFTLTRDEERDYGRILRERQDRAGGWDYAWAFYLAAIPVGLLGGFAAIAFGIDGRRFGAIVATLTGIAYMLGYYAAVLSANLLSRRLAATMRNLPGFRDERSVSIGTSGIDMAWRSSRSFCDWRDMTDLTQERGLLIFWVGYRTAITVPQRALPDADVEVVLQLVKARLGSMRAPRG